jgi:pyruvate/2-oxoglutarate dehydrogenase complex dihydrolipoamide acyltransferase (E2) component
MPTVFRLPDIGEGLTEAEIVEWHASVGDEVRADAPLVTVETDKAQAELPAPVSGVLLHRGAEEGVVLPVGAVLAVIGIRGERWEGGEEPQPQPTLPLATAVHAPSERPPLVGTLSEDAEDLAVGGTPTVPGAAQVAGPAGDARAQIDAPSQAGDLPAAPDVATPVVRPRTLPLVRREAARRGIDLDTVRGTGPGGRVRRADIHATGPQPAPGDASTGAATAAGPAPADEPGPSRLVAEGSTRLRLSATRRAIARNLTEAWTTIPQVTTFGAFDATRLLAVRRALSDRHGRTIPLDALLAASVLPVLAAHPEANATLDGDDLVLHESVDLGVAIAAPGGLVVATVRRAQQLGLLGLAESIVGLADRAAERRLAPSELGGQTFTVSNIGAVGGGHGTPIVPLGTTAILSVGRAVSTPVARAGEVAIAPMAPLSLSYDHRVIDGAEGRAILALLIENLEEPTLFLV